MPSDPNDKLTKAIADARQLAEDQLSAAWRMQTERVREMLDTEWSGNLRRVFGERFTDLEATLRSASDEAANDLARASARRELAAELNEFARRLRQAGSRDVWIGTLLDAASRFCERVALFSVADGVLRGEGVRGGAAADVSGLEFPLFRAPALASAVESKETVVAMGSAREVSSAIAERLGGNASKVYLFPLIEGGLAAGVLYVECGGEIPDVSALELVAQLAASSMVTGETAVETPADALIQIGGAAASKAPRADVSSLTPPARQLHLRAQRFARTSVAAMLLGRLDAVKEGRESRTLYATLKSEIDAGRDAFREEFLAEGGAMPDYYHQELVRTLAAGDKDLLGSDYPGAGS